jgi:hypothetical protein
MFPLMMAVAGLVLAFKAIFDVGKWGTIGSRLGSSACFLFFALVGVWLLFIPARQVISDGQGHFTLSTWRGAVTTGPDEVLSLTGLFIWGPISMRITPVRIRTTAGSCWINTAIHEPISPEGALRGWNPDMKYKWAWDF